MKLSQVLDVIGYGIVIAVITTAIICRMYIYAVGLAGIFVSSWYLSSQIAKLYKKAKEQYAIKKWILDCLMITLLTMCSILLGIAIVHQVI